MTGNQLNNRLGLNAQSARYRETGDWYHPLANFPGILFDVNGYLIFETIEDYENNPEIQYGQDIHIPDGISSFDNYVQFTDIQTITVNELKKDYEGVLRVKREYSTYVRNPQNVKDVKDAFQNTCAICRTRILIDRNKYYSEAHHIKPLNEDGPDITSNMICLCPNCHVKLDLKALRIIRQELHNPNNHIINEEFIDYHNRNVN